VGLTHLQARLERWRWAPGALGAAAIAGVLLTASLPVFRDVLPFARSWPAEPGLADEIRAGGDPGFSPRAGGRVYWARRSDRQRVPASVDAVHDMEPLTLARTAELLTFFETGRGLTLLTVPHDPARRPGDSGDYLAPPFFGYLVLPPHPARAPILDLFSVTTLVAEDPPAWLDDRYVRRSPPEARLAVFDNPHALPRAYRVASALPEPEGVQRELAALVHPDFDPRRRVWLDAPPPDLLPGRARRTPPPLVEAEILDYAPERVVLRSDGDRAGVVVLNDAHYPGWEATVDGAPAPVLRANFGFRAVPVPAGPHEVVMRYRPPLFRASVALAGVAALACLVACGAPRLRGARPRTDRWRPGSA
jgi:hypothetical protein